jgi:multiple sugar transport system permease protein
LPKELEEAGRIDGLKEFGIYFRIMLPLCGPAIITQVVLTFNMCWNDLLWPLLIMNSPDKRMLSTGIANMISQDTIEYGPAFAAGVISIIPLFILFLVGQKYFVNSIIAGALKE